MVILTAFEDHGLILQLIQAGATGYLLKESKTNEVIRAIRTAYGGESLIDPKVAQKMMRMMMGMSAQTVATPKTARPINLSN